MPAPAWTTLGRYTVLGKIASGGMAEVFLARQEGPQGFEKTVVIKRILPRFAQDEEFVQLFLNEARLAALIDHPNVVGIYELGEDEQSFYIAMEFIDGCSLRRLISRAQKGGTGLDLASSARIIAEACAGLDFAHELRDRSGRPLHIVHRDVSPENLLVSFAGRVKVVDFGIAKAAHMESLTRTGQVRGKLSTMAPEQLLGQSVDRRADVWALGATLYWLLAGQRPFQGASEGETLNRILHEDPPPLRKQMPAVPRDLEGIVLRALEKNPERRTATARALQIELEDFMAQRGLAVTSASLADELNEEFPEDRDPERTLRRKILASQGRPLPAARGTHRTGKGEFDLSAQVPDFSEHPSDPDLDAELGEGDELLEEDTGTPEASFTWLRFAYWLVACGLACGALVVSVQRGPALWRGLVARVHEVLPFLAP
jgi:eukaryotic-like serine/threonine-protein kinase